MTLNAAQLLRSLGAGLVPTPTTGRDPAPGALDFAALLDRARAGGLSSGQPVRIDDAAGVDLSADQLDRLARATDAADAAGAQRLFAVIDGAGVVIDVRSRTIVRAVELNPESGEPLRPADVLTGIDAAAVVPPGDQEPSVVSFNPGAPVRRAALAPLLGRVENGSLIERLAQAPALL